MQPLLLAVLLLLALLLLKPLAPAVHADARRSPASAPALKGALAAAAVCTAAAAVAYTTRPCSAMATWAAVHPFPASVPTLKVRLLPLYRAVAS